MEEGGELDRVDVLQIHGGDGDGAEFIFDFNGQRIAVSIFPSPSIHGQNQNSTQDRLVSLLDRLASGEVDDNDDDELMDDALEVIMDAGRPIFKAQAPPCIKLNAPRDLHSLIYPTILHFQLLENCGKTTITPIAPTEAYTLSAEDEDYDSAEEDELDIDATLPCYLSRAILATEMFVEGSGHVASRVLVDGTEMFCKALGSVGGLIGTSVGRELGCFQEVRKLSLPEPDTTIRIPHLLGYVRHADTDRIIGFLRQWVPGQRLRDIQVPAMSAQQKQKWITQIREAVHTLHERGIIWGDGKASNVIIDEGDDAWLIDFGGGWTEGWVNADLADTVEGDEQAISSIREFLQVDREG